MASLPLDPIALTVIAFAVFLITFMKGMFGGGFAIVGIPLMALVMEPIAAGALLALVLCLSDIVALLYWRPSTWSKPDLKVLLPGQLHSLIVQHHGFLAPATALDRTIKEFAQTL